MVEFAPAFGALLVDAVLRQARNWTIELHDADGRSLGVVRITLANPDGTQAVRVATEHGIGLRDGRPAAFRLLSGSGVPLLTGDCGKPGSGAALELGGEARVERAAPIELAGSFRW